MDFGNVRGLHNIRETRSFSHRFFDDLEQLNNDFDNFVIDVSTSYSTVRGRKYVSDLFPENSSTEEAINLLGGDSFERTERNDKEVLRFTSTPYSRLKTIDRLDGRLFLPDTTRECVESSDRPMDDVEGVLKYLEEASESLPIKDVMGIESYDVVGLEGVGMSEDEATVTATSELEGESLILSYDQDFIDYSTAVTAPELFYEAVIR